MTETTLRKPYTHVVATRKFSQLQPEERLERVHALKGFVYERFKNAGEISEPVLSGYKGAEYFRGEKLLHVHAHVSSDIREKIEDLGFEVRIYSTEGRKNRVISISEDLSLRPVEDQFTAIRELENYLESRPYIWTGYDEAFSIAQAVSGFSNGLITLRERFRPEVIRADLTKGEKADIKALGFDVKKPLVYEVYAM